MKFKQLEKKLSAKIIQLYKVIISKNVSYY